MLFLNANQETQDMNDLYTAKERNMMMVRQVSLNRIKETQEKIEEILAKDWGDHPHTIAHMVHKHLDIIAFESNRIKVMEKYFRND